MADAVLDLLAQAENRQCADCGAPNPQWAAWNLGVFVCTRCSGMHRHLGTHVSKVKSVTLDTWTPVQIQSMVDGGNARANALFMARIPPGYVKPDLTLDAGLLVFIRSKYERRLFVDASPLGRSQGSPAQDAAQQGEFMDVYVSQPETEWDLLNGGRGRVTTYLVTASTNLSGYAARHFSVRRRYNEFERLYRDLLRETGPQQDAQATARTHRIPELPRKTLAWENRFSPEVIEARRSAFDRLLNALTTHPALRRSDALRVFLTATVPLPPPSPPAMPTTVWAAEPAPAATATDAPQLVVERSPWL